MYSYANGARCYVVRIDVVWLTVMSLTSTPTRADSATATLKALIIRWLLFLGCSLMENIYQDAVTSCLNGGFDTCGRAGEDVLEEFPMLYSR